MANRVLSNVDILPLIIRNLTGRDLANMPLVSVAFRAACAHVHDVQLDFAVLTHSEAAGLMAAVNAHLEGDESIYSDTNVPLLAFRQHTTNVQLCPRGGLYTTANVLALPVFFAALRCLNTAQCQIRAGIDFHVLTMRILADQKVAFSHLDSYLTHWCNYSFTETGEVMCLHRVQRPLFHEEDADTDHIEEVD